ncbi:transient-receptor-potential-like protein [Neocloeon triangulifer]|uniref:transient-receptor-potential-like protein n=1 Tax=Neocloeon triangulifer TaxID=2078957 RepID=UPI00286F7ED3|nr:transient-receptor-potential-like protein [Neocloeon triangulifer]XP_059484450.1 transient-receptor-potential-like protein [Neocloeon triangulifer]XP_059484451.1 transient-receptor-potential-like protein [Neocloeon triangulifer]
MADEKKGPIDLEKSQPRARKTCPIAMPKLPKPLTLEEKRYLLAVERGDAPNVRRILQKAYQKKHINIDCMDSLGRGAMLMAIDNENLDMVELLIVMGVATKDSLLHAIEAEFVEAVELLLQHEELIHKEGEAHSWEKVDPVIATFPPDITPLTLAAHKDNFEIIKILLDRGATLPMPHDIKCGCDECIIATKDDSLRHSLARVNAYRALASPSLIALSSNDPIMTAFELSWELRNLAFTEQECKGDYLELRRQCQQFAVNLLSHTRGSRELAIILNHDPESEVPYEDGEHMKLARLEQAINFKQKTFVAHPNIQQLLAAIWYEGVPGFRRLKATQKLMEIVKVAVLFPFYCMLYMLAPNCKTGKLVRKPFMKFLLHASSYLFFLLLLILVSQRAEVLFVQIFGTESMKADLQEELKRQRGNGPTYLELLVCLYVFGFIFEETKEIVREGIGSYLRNMWNIIDFTRNSLYVAVMMLRGVAWMQQQAQITADPASAYVPREHWDDFDPQLISEGLCAAANVFSALKLVHLFSINPHLGPLQISLGRMVIDIVKFFFIYSLVLFAFACGLNQLLWYFADLEKQRCYSLPGGLPDWNNHGDSCVKWRRFGNLFESSQSLFWASFGMVGLDDFELIGIKSYTRFWGLLMFGSYSVINVIVLLNLLIAMMSNSYAAIVEHSDTEWKFARTKLWMSYFEESATLPPPFNIIPTPKHMMKMLGLRKKDKMRRMSTKRKEKVEKERDFRYTAVMRALIWRYVAAMQRKQDDNPVTEDDINEVKSEITSMKCEILETLAKNGMNVDNEATKDKVVLGKKMRVWERRLMKDFHVAPVAGEETFEELQAVPPPENEDKLAKFRRLAKLAVLQSSSHKWGEVIREACKSSQIGRSCSRESFKNQQYLQKAMQEAKKLQEKPSRRGHSPTPSPIPMVDPTRDGILTLLKEIREETGNNRSPVGSIDPNMLSVDGPGKSRSVSPIFLATNTLKQQQQQQQIHQSTTQLLPSVPAVAKIQSETQRQADTKEPLPAATRDAPKVIKKKQPLDEPTISIPRPQKFEGKAPAPPVPSVTKPQENPSVPRVEVSKSAEASKAKKPAKELEPPKQPEMKKPEPPKPPEVKKQPEALKMPQVPSVEITASTPVMPHSGRFSSTEQLIPESDPPSPDVSNLRVGQKVDGVSTIKRQPKTGWL